MARPEKKFRCGAVEAAVFVNEIEKGGKTLRLKKVSIQKRYRDGDGNWNSTNSYDANDLPKLKLVADEAYRYLALGQNGENGDPHENSNSD
jgi:hypothetical protein